MALLFTDIQGFVGSILVSALKEHHSIYGLDIVPLEREGVLKTYSWNELELLPAVDTIIHLADKVHETNPPDHIHSEYFDINTELTKTIFDYFLQSNAKQFIFFSSVKAAADRVEGDYLTEDVVSKSIDPYGDSKIAAEKYIWSKGKRYTIHGSPHLEARGWGKDKRVYIFRPCMINGLDKKEDLNLLYKFVNKGIPYPFGAFDNKRSFLNIENLTYIVEKFILQNPPSGIYHLADDEAISTNELIELIAQSKCKKAKILHLNKVFIKVIAKIGDYTRLHVNSDRLKKLTENYVVSNRKMKHALRIERLPFDVKEGLIKTLKTF